MTGADLVVLALPDLERRQLTIKSRRRGRRAAGTGPGSSHRGVGFGGGAGHRAAGHGGGLPPRRAGREGRQGKHGPGTGDRVPAGRGRQRPRCADGWTATRVHAAAPGLRWSCSTTFAAQAAIALELAERRRDAERLAVFEDRDRIARDLHDLVIQRLYASGMKLQGTIPLIDRPQAAERVSSVVDDLDATIKDIRTGDLRPAGPGHKLRPGLREKVMEVIEQMTGPMGMSSSLRLDDRLDSAGSRRHRRGHAARPAGGPVECRPARQGDAASR